MGLFDPLYTFMHSKGNFVGQLDHMYNRHKQARKKMQKMYLLHSQ